MQPFGAVRRKKRTGSARSFGILPDAARQCLIIILSSTLLTPSVSRASLSACFFSAAVFTSPVR